MHMEVRKNIVEAWKNGVKIVEISKAYGVSASAINRLFKQVRETGDMEPKTYLRGRKPTLTEGDLQVMRELILSRPDITLEEIKREMGLAIGVSAISYIVRDKLGFRYKKRQYMPVSEIDPMS